MGELPHLPVTSHIGATLNFETLERQVSELQEQGKRHGGGDVGAWTTLTLGAKVQAVAGPTPSVRAEAGKTISRFRGLVQIKAEETLTAGETLATIPVGFRPPAEVFTPTVTTAGIATYLLINTSGNVSVHTTVGAGVDVLLDGITFNLT